MLSKALGQAARPPDAKAEVGQLVERARLHAQLGDWQEALALTEAALVLDPGRFDLHRDAVNLLNRVYFQKLRDQPQRRTNNPADWLEERLAREMLPTGLYHEEAYLLNTCVKGQDSWTFPASADYLFRTLEFRPDRESFESYLKEHQEEIESIQAMCKRVLEAKKRGNVQDETPVLLFSFYERPMPKKGNGFKIDDWCRKYLEEHLQEVCDARLRFLEDFSYLNTRAWAPVVELHITFRPSDTAAEEPIYAAFLKKVQSMPNRESKAFADNILNFNAMAAAPRRKRSWPPPKRRTSRSPKTMPYIIATA